MSQRIKLIDIELTQPLPNFEDLTGYEALWATLRWQHRPLGRIWVNVSQGRCSASAIQQAILPSYNYAILRELLVTRLLQPAVGWSGLGWSVADLLDLPAPVVGDRPKVTIAYCVSDRTNFALGMAALLAQSDQDLEILVVESLPSDDWVKDWVAQQAPRLEQEWRYIPVADAGLNQARNAAITAATGEVIAFCDDRTLPDAQWASTIATTFAQNPQVQIVTGLITPAVIEQSIQKHLTDSGHIPDRGLLPLWFHLDETPTWPDLGTMRCGSGMNMACRVSLFQQIGRFNPALSHPGSTWTGGDLEFFCRALLAQQTILYEPAVTTQYVIPTDDRQLQDRFRQELTGLYSFIQAGQGRYPELKSQFRMLGLWQFGQLVQQWRRPHCPRHWITQQIKGILQSRDRYAQGLTDVNALAPNPQSLLAYKSLKTMAVRQIDLAQPLPAMLDVSNYKGVRVYLTHGDRPIGQVDVQNNGSEVSAIQLARAIGDQIAVPALARLAHLEEGELWATADRCFAEHWRVPTEAIQPKAPQTYPPLPLDVPVSVIITTCDRPDDLRNCLSYLLQQSTPRKFEIIVADNRPASGLTRAVVDQFPAVRYVPEARPGGSYGRNAAFVASTGEIVVTVDDDVTVPPDWLEKLLAPMNRPEVMVVTGNVLPVELDTEAQWMFESIKGGLGEGFQGFEADRDWLDSFDRSPPTWDLGVSANSAFRATIFSHPEIGMMDEVLGPGTPTVGGEENHLIYKVLRAGYTLVYEPSAFAWHRHRRDIKGFYKQIHGHMKGGTAYHMVLWQQEKDLRAKRQLLVEMPTYLRKYVIERILGKHKTPWPLIWSEVSGYVAGFWGYYQSVQRLKVLGRSAPYVPLSQRPEEARLHPARQVQLAPEPPAVVEVQEPLKLNS